MITHIWHLASFGQNYKLISRAAECCSQSEYGPKMTCDIGVELRKILASSGTLAPAGKQQWDWPHARTAVGLQVQQLVGGGVGGQAQGRQAVHDQVHPQHLHRRQRALLRRGREPRIAPQSAGVDCRLSDPQKVKAHGHLIRQGRDPQCNSNSHKLSRSAWNS